MPTCDYCGESFDSDEAEREHLQSEHAEELGPIDRRRVGLDEEDTAFPTGPIAIAGIAVAALAIVALIVFFAGAPGPDGRTGQPPAQLEMSTSGTFNQQGTVVNMRMHCPQCGAYCQGCPQCDDTLAKAVAGMPGVFGAQFKANESTQSAIKIEYDPANTSLAAIKQKITSTSPYPGCCADLTTVS